MIEAIELWLFALGILCGVIGYLVKSMKDQYKAMKDTENADERAFRESVRKDLSHVKSFGASLDKRLTVVEDRLPRIREGKPS